MKLEITRKGRLYCADCTRCGGTLWAHEWVTPDFSGTRDALADGDMRCPDCPGHAEATTFADAGLQYAERYRVPGVYTTAWHFNTNKAKLMAELNRRSAIG